MRDDFAALILTHKRPDNIRTLASLKRCGYTGRWYLVVDDEDPALGEYQRRYGEERVLIFSKAEIAQTMDLADAGGSMSVVVFARNACDRLAAELGLTWYIQLDDDYTTFGHRYTNRVVLLGVQMHRLDEVFEELIEFAERSNALTVCFAQGGDYVGGFTSKFFRDRITRKAMNTFLCRVGRPVEFLGRINEDVNAYVVHGGRGELMFTITDIYVTQVRTQSSEGGMTQAYLDDGTYRKSFYTVMMRPDAAVVALMGKTHERPHHRICWNQAVPRIVSDRYQKAS